MGKIFTSAEELIGRTPLLELGRIAREEGLAARVLGKLEYLNPAGSAKDRVALAMLDDGEARGVLKPGSVIIEPTSGNTGIGLACVAAVRGYRTIIVMPDTMSRERQQLMTAYGAELGSSGTGIVLSADGYIITNYHVIEGTSRAVVTPLNTGKGSTARLVGYDESMDVAVLKVEKTDLIPAEFGSSRELVPGQKVYAIGNPMGYLYGSITDGIVSYVNRTVSVGGHGMTLIQTNAALNSGNSGGALVNAWGQVVGITVAKIDPPSEVTNEGLGLAIPISEARRCVNTLLRSGKMENPAIGISCRDWPSGDGVLVLEVNEGSPAQEAGLEVNDVILTAGGMDLDGVDTLKDIIFDLGVGAELDCTVLRNNRELDFTLELREAEP